MNFDSWSRKGVIRSSIVLMVYTIVFIIAFNRVGGTFSAFAVLPAAIAGLYLGISGGLAFGTLSVIATIIVFTAFGELDVFLTRGITGIILIFILGIGTGWLSTLLRTVQQQSDALKHEIEERKQAELARERSEATLHAVTNNAPILLWNVSNDKTIHVLEGNALQSLGMESNILVGKAAQELFTILPDMRQNLEDALHGETKHGTIAGDDFLFDAHYIPILNDEKVVESVVGVATDITEQQQTKTALDEAQSKISDQEQRIRRLYTMIDLMLKQLNSVFQHGASREELKIYMDTLNTEFSHLQEVILEKQAS